MSDVEVFIGFDPRERMAWNVCARSLLAHSSYPPPVQPIARVPLQGLALYTRPTGQAHGLWDEISKAPMATEFALARFFVPFVSHARWALYVDGDFLFRADVGELFRLADPRFAVQVVKHEHAPEETVKMDGQAQSAYPRKNWSSAILWNLRHIGNGPRYSIRDANAKPGLWLHSFGWLKDEEIGDLPLHWNWLEGSSTREIEPKAVHYTRGTPDLPGYGDSAYADEWFRYLTAAEHLAYEGERLTYERERCAQARSATG